MLLASGSEQTNDTNNSETNNTNNSETDNTNNTQEKLSPKQEDVEKELSKAQEDLEDLEEEVKHVQQVYDKHNRRHAEAQDESDSETENFEVGFLEEIKPNLDKLQEELENAQEHVQTLTDLLKSFF